MHTEPVKTFHSHLLALVIWRDWRMPPSKIICIRTYEQHYMNLHIFGRFRLRVPSITCKVAR